MKTILILFASLFISAYAGTEARAQSQTLHDLYAISIDGDTILFSAFKGMKVMVVNTASRCSLTPQYKALQELYETYGGENFIILAFPANDFANREPGDNEDIKEFCREKYGISFPIMQKTSVKGENMHPVYQWLTQASENGVADFKIKWNFQKFLIDEEGRLVDSVDPLVKPDSERVVEWINR